MIPLSQIESISISNFQSHKRTEITPAPAGQLTVIVGPSDSGKTAIIRALKWLLYNRPQGSDFIRVGASMVKVTMETGAGKAIRQRSSGGINRYIIPVQGADPVNLEGFGGDVPLEIQEITGVRQTTIGDMSLSLNLAEQLDGPFLGSKSISDPVRARVLGKLAGTEEVDHANKQLGTDLYRRNQEKKSAEEDVKRLTEQMEQFENLPRLQELAEQLGQMIEAARRGIEKTQRLKALYSDMLARQSQADHWRAAVDRLWPVNTAAGLWAVACEAVTRRAKLSSIGSCLDMADGDCKRLAHSLEIYVDVDRLDGQCSSAVRGHRDLKQLKSILAQLHQAEDAKWAAGDTRDKLARKIGWVEVDYKRAAELAQRLQTLDVKDAAYAGQGLKLTCARDMIVLHENEIAQYTGAYRDALVAAGQCPTCGGQIDPEKIREVV